MPRLLGAQRGLPLPECLRPVSSCRPVDSFAGANRIMRQRLRGHYNSPMIELFRLSLWVLRRRLRPSKNVGAWGTHCRHCPRNPGGRHVAERHCPYTPRPLPRPGCVTPCSAGAPRRCTFRCCPRTGPLGPEDYAELRGVAEEAIQRRLSALTVSQERFGRTQAGMPLTANPEQQPPTLGAPSGRLFFMTGFTEHSRLISGRWPQTGGTSGPQGSGSGGRDRRPGSQRHGV